MEMSLQGQVIVFASFGLHLYAFKFFSRIVSAINANVNTKSALLLFLIQCSGSTSASQKWTLNLEHSAPFFCSYFPLSLDACGAEQAIMTGGLYARRDTVA